MSRRVYLPTEYEGSTNSRIKIHQSAQESSSTESPKASTTPMQTTMQTTWLATYSKKPGAQTRKHRKHQATDPGMTWEAPTSPLPTLRAIILDLAAVNNVDVTSMQNLIDVRNQWTKRALAAARFGFHAVSDGSVPRWQRSIFNSKDVEAGLKVQDNSASTSFMNVFEDDIQVVGTGERGAKINTHRRRGRSGVGTSMAVVDRINRPFFHVDLTSALESACG
ncbi:hypothetical protein N7491_008590 [Penicillium cf. griseofulvum]|nr:hypothetical protein N7491_008590 [Penicillium cf. griseofulvum]